MSIFSLLALLGSLFTDFSNLEKRSLRSFWILEELPAPSEGELKSLPPELLPPGVRP